MKAERLLIAGMFVLILLVSVVSSATQTAKSEKSSNGSLINPALSSLKNKILSSVKNIKLDSKSTSATKDNALTGNAVVLATNGKMDISSEPEVTNWRRDGTTPYKMNIYLDSTGIPTKKIVAGQFHFTMPSVLNGKMIHIGSSLPNGNPSTNPLDFWYPGYTMSSDDNRIDLIMSGIELDDNVRSVSVNDGPSNRRGLFGWYNFIILPTAQLGINNSAFHSVLVSDTTYSGGSTGKYVSVGGGNSTTMTVTNTPFNIVDVPGAQITNPVNGTIITGGTEMLGARVTNNVSQSDTLYFNVSRSVINGSAALGAINPGTSGNLSALSNQTYNFSVSSTNIGNNVIRFSTAGTGLDSGNALANQSINLNLIVLDNSFASFSSGSNQRDLIIDFGNVNAGETTTQNFSIWNRARGEGYRVGLDLDSIDSFGSTAFTNNLVQFDNLLQGLSNNYLATFNATNLNAGEYIKQINISLSDDDAFNGAAGNKVLTLNLRGNVVIPIIQISQCGILNQSTTYFLTSDIVNNDLNGNCLTVSAPDVVVDCQNNWVRSSRNYAGVYTNQFNTSIRNCKIDMGDGDGGAGIIANNSDYSMANNNYIYMNNQGIEVYSSKNVRIEGNIVTGLGKNSVLNGNGSSKAGILADNSRNISINSNNLSGNYYGIRGVLGNDAKIIFNEVREGVYGIVIFGNSSNILNNFVDSNSWGIMVGGNENHIENNFMGGNDDAMHVWGNYNLIKNNSARGNSYGIVINGGAYNQVVENNAYGNHHMGIGVGGIGFNSITGNFVSGSWQLGGFFIRSQNNTISFNTAYGNKDADIHCYSSGNIGVQNNFGTIISCGDGIS